MEKMERHLLHVNITCMHMCIRRALGLKLRRSARIAVRVNTTTGIIPGPNGPEPTLVAELGSTRSVYSASTVCLQQRQETYSPRLLLERIAAVASSYGAHYKRSYRLLPER